MKVGIAVAKGNEKVYTVNAVLGWESHTKGNAVEENSKKGVNPMGRMERMERVRKAIDSVVSAMPEEQERKEAAAHLHGVSLYCALLARKRRENEELAVIAGLLHDIYRCAALEACDHAAKGAVMAHEILEGLEMFTAEEIGQISTAICHHSDKLQVHTGFDEILKDADVMEHVFSQPLAMVQPNERERYEKLASELRL